MPKTLQDWGALLGILAVIVAVGRWLFWPFWLWQHKRTSRAAFRLMGENGKSVALVDVVAHLRAENRDMKRTIGDLQASAEETDQVIRDELPAIRTSMELTHAACQRTELSMSELRQTLDAALLRGFGNR